MVIAGTRKRKIQGARANMESRVEYPLPITLNCPGMIHMNRLFSSRKTTITTYPVRLLKNPLISFLNNVHISDPS